MPDNPIVETDTNLVGRDPEASETSEEQQEGVSSTFEESVDEGETRLNRSWSSLLATGTVGGADIGIGIFAMYVVMEATGSRMLGSLAFTIGFVALLLAHSELFTENFLVPVTAVIARRGSVAALIRLWVGTLIMNLIGGWLITALIVIGLPKLDSTILEIGNHVGQRSVGLEAFASAVLAGSIITLMTWMERGTDSVPAKLVSAVSLSFLLAAGPLLHSIAGSVEMFAALHVGADFGYLRWLEVFAIAAIGNLVGGLGLVTTLRLAQVGKRKLEAEQNYSDKRSDQKTS